jgi:N-acetylglucosaminyldiphosphoundecaprenol N-acetyl-beta-D-mannosaminyltransferase
VVPGPGGEWRVHDRSGPERVDVLGVPVDVVDMAGAVALADRAIRSGAENMYALAVNPEKVIALLRDRALAGFYARAGLLVPDGIGVVWAARLLGDVRMTRVTGADLMQELCALAARRSYPVYLYGAKEEVSAAAEIRLRARLPALRVAGRANGYVPAEGMDDLVARINDSGAKLLFVALGSPRQERWIARYSPRLRVNVIQGIGGTLDTIAGNVRRAPRSWQRAHLEWMYRLLDDPRRLRRQSALAVFAWKVLMEKLASRSAARPEIPSDPPGTAFASAKPPTAPSPRAGPGRRAARLASPPRPPRAPGRCAPA